VNPEGLGLLLPQGVPRAAAAACGAKAEQEEGWLRDSQVHLRAVAPYT
jgi:hypothetical protein